MCTCMCTRMYGWDKEAAKEFPAKERQKFRAENGSDLNGPVVDHGQVRWSLRGTHDLVLLGQAIPCI